MPYILIQKLNPVLDLNSRESVETFTFMNFLLAINQVVMIGDGESQYFVLYSLLGVLSRLDLQESQMTISMREGAKLLQLDYQTLCCTLITSGIMQNVLTLPIKSSDEDVIRVCLKLLITIMFKGQNNKLFFFDQSASIAQRSNQSVSLEGSVFE